MNKKHDINCARCKVHACRRTDKKVPSTCPMINSAPALEKARDKYKDGEDREHARAAALIEAGGYLQWCRVEEIMEYAREMKFHRIGLAFCTGLAAEARIFADILEKAGFEVVSAMCKTGSIPKEEAGLKDEEKIRPGTAEMLCNPVGQAMLLDDAGADFNVLLGLCVGHDTLFIKHSKAPITVLAVKDRVLAHNPINALYCHDTYFRTRWDKHRAE